MTERIQFVECVCEAGSQNEIFACADLVKGLCQVQCCKPFELAMQRGPADYRAKPASLQRYQLAMRSFSRVR